MCSELFFSLFYKTVVIGPVSFSFNRKKNSFGTTGSVECVDLLHRHLQGFW